MTRIKAIKTYFEQTDSLSPDGGKKISMIDLKSLNDDDKQELGELSAKELGVELTAK